MIELIPGLSSALHLPAGWPRHVCSDGTHATDKEMETCMVLLGLAAETPKHSSHILLASARQETSLD